jgi:glutathione S-transferase
MALTLYHAEPVANSLKSLISLHEKGLDFKSVYVDLHKFEQHQPWFVAINPEGQVPVLDHDGAIITPPPSSTNISKTCFPRCLCARMFPDMVDAVKYPRLTDWVERMRARPGVAAALARPDMTNPALRTFTGEVH